jgi:hypothetical protein
MKKHFPNSLLAFSLINLISILFSINPIIILTGCANIIPPEGGPRDTIPPVLLKVEPLDSSKNFKEKKITLTFDEYIDVKEIQENVIVSPTPVTMPIIDYKLNTLTVRLKDTLEANTTYSINFGNSIRDINEGNPARDLTFIFTTGNVIDSLEFTGNVLLAETGKTDTTLIVMLYKNLTDSAVVNERPRYIAKLDGKGNFIFQNLPPGIFNLYALKDEGGSRRYLNPSQIFAFADSAVIVSPNSKPVTLYAYKEKEATTITIPVPGRSSTQEKRLRFSTNLINNQQDLLGNFEMTFDLPIRTYDSTAISFSSDSAFVPVTNYNLKFDSTRRKLQLTHPWKENTIYNLILNKEFAADTIGRKLLKSDTITFNTRSRNDYGSVRIRFKNIDLSKNPVLLLVQNDNVARSFPLTSVELNQPLVLPGDYELRILYDANKNGKWDHGEFFGKHKQPEYVQPIERRLNVKPAGQSDVEITL